MFLSPHCRSSLALTVALLLGGAAALPLTLCASSEPAAPCFSQTGATTREEDCHHSQMPSASLSCCCDQDDATAPGAPVAQTLTDSALTPLIMPASAAIAWPSAILRSSDATALLVPTRPLFTLHSVFLL